MRQNQQGFTLVELLIVLLIVGVLLGITLLTPMISSVDKCVKQEAARLQTLFKGMRDKAFLTDTDYGFSIDSSGCYKWWELLNKSKEWVVLKDKPYQPFCMGEGYEIQLKTDELNGENTDDNELKIPCGVFFSGRESTPFSLSIIPKNNKEKALRLQTDGVSDVEIFHE